MKIVGVVVEYNPFHNGHMHHLKEARRLTGAKHIIAIMSGNFVQRGEPAIVDKNIRTRMALNAGVDVVIELPLVYALSSAGYFAAGAVSLLDSIGVVDSIAFGAESSANQLEAIAAQLKDESPQFKDLLRQNLSRGLSYPDARARALGAMSDTATTASVLAGPNNILGVEYINSLLRLGSKISVTTIERTTAHIGGHTDNFASASQIRKLLLAGRQQEAAFFMPNFATEALKCADTLHKLANLGDLLHYRIRTQAPAQLRDIAEISEGLENRIAALSRKHTLLDDIISHVKTKRYTLSKIKRCFLNIILDIRKDYFAQAHSQCPPYARVLGFRRESQHLLRHIQAASKVPLITNIKNRARLDPHALKTLELELVATDIYALSANKNNLPHLSSQKTEYLTPIIG